jgi:hypothetical protein
MDKHHVAFTASEKALTDQTSNSIPSTLACISNLARARVLPDETSRTRRRCRYTFQILASYRRSSSSYESSTPNPVVSALRELFIVMHTL